MTWVNNLVTILVGVLSKARTTTLLR
uniref:Uncharacterized protein n=1 Tax=Anguilla anguilla TaxID=7936 RepID=A0A0E9RTP5_ANGAN